MSGLSPAARLELIGDQISLSRQFGARGEPDPSRDALILAVEELTRLVGDLHREVTS